MRKNNVGVLYIKCLEENSNLEVAAIAELPERQESLIRLAEALTADAVADVCHSADHSFDSADSSNSVCKYPIKMV